jgi:sensor domain CHASE-containing protein
MAIQSKNSILQHWQPLVGIAAFLVAGGQFYSEMRTTKKDVDAIQQRQDRQFQMIMEQQKSVTILEKQAAYNEGYLKAEKELRK